MAKSKRLFLKSKRSFRSRFPRIKSSDQIDYQNTDLLSSFVSNQGKILSRRVTKVTLKHQRLITLAIKQARILASLPFDKKKMEKFDKKKMEKNAITRGKKNRIYRGKKNRIDFHEYKPKRKSNSN